MAGNKKILECIYNIDCRVLNLKSVTKYFRPDDFPSVHPVHVDIMNYSVVKMCSVFDELMILKRLCKDDSYLRDVFYCLKPINDYILQYEKGFQLMRNNMVAHFQRDKAGNFRPTQSTLQNLNVPRDNAEWSFIYDCLELLRQVLVSKFPDYPEFLKVQLSEFVTRKDVFAKTFKPKVALYIEDFKKEVNQRLSEKGMSSIEVS